MKDKSDLETLKALYKRLESDPYNGADEEALEIIKGEEEGADWLDEDALDDYINNTEDWTAERLAIFLADYSPRAPYGYRFDGYGNIATVTARDIMNALDDIVTRINLESD